MADSSRPSPAAGRLRRVAGHVVLVVVGLVVGLALLEIALQAGSVVVRATARRATVSGATPDRRVVTIGDSNTYGAGVDRDQAYPSVLEQLWNASPDAMRIEVVNLGFPGTNSSAARNILRHALETLHPDVITVMVGANDWWTESEQLRGAGWRQSFASWLWQHSRVYRLLLMIRRATAKPTAVITDEQGDLGGLSAVMHVGDASTTVGFQPRDPSTKVDDPFATLVPNLTGMIDDARQAGTDVVLITYPAGGLYGVASDAMRKAAKDTGVPVVDVGRAFRPECWRGGRCALLLPDGHPSVEGHHRTAEILFDALRGRVAGAAARPAEPRLDAPPPAQ